MEFFMYICPICKKVYKVKGLGKHVKCSNCNDILLDMNVAIEVWANLNQEEKTKHISHVLNKPEESHKTENGKKEISTSSENTPINSMKNRYMYCCHACKSIEKYDKKDGIYRCDKCGQNLVGLGISELVWNKLDKDNKKEIIDFSKKKIESKPEIEVKEAPVRNQPSDTQPETSNKGFSFFAGEEKLPTKVETNDDVIICPECGEKISKDCKECSNCGYPIRAERMDAPYISNNNVCPECKQSIPAKSITCPNCGFPINQTISGAVTDKKKHNQPSSNKRFKLVGIIGIAISVIVLIVVVGWFFRDLFISEVYVTGFAKTMKIGTEIQYHAHADPKFADTGIYKWSSSDPTVATVNNEGLVTIVGNGECEIIAKARNGKYDVEEIEMANIKGGYWECNGVSEDYDFYADYVYEGVDIVLYGGLLDVDGHDITLTLYNSYEYPVEGKWEYIKTDGDGIAYYKVKPKAGTEYEVRVKDDRMVMSISKNYNLLFLRDWSY